MKKISTCKNLLLSLALISTSSFAADEFKFLPIFLDDNYKAELEVSAVVGSMNFNKNTIKEDITYGVELSFNCPVFTLPNNHVLRQQLSLNRYDKGGLKITTIEMNPYYFVSLSDDLSFGFGPGIGAMKAELANGQDEWLFTFQAGAGLKYYMDNFLIGADFRYQWAAEKDFGTGVNQDLDNKRFLLKVGYAF